MKINKIKLDGWRNCSRLEFDFHDITIFVGKNGAGKTNFLEGVYYLATGKSFRTKDEFLIGWDKEFARIFGELEKAEKKEDLLVVLEKKIRVIKTVKIKGQKKPSSHLLGHLNCILFTPEEIELISTLPEARRRYLNLIISQINRGYAYSLLHYRRTLEHRNSLLRRINEGLAKREELEVWDGKLAEYGSEIIKQREQYISAINETIAENYKVLSDQEQNLEIQYLPSVTGEWAGLVTKLLDNREKDIKAKVTTIGPHRDDFAFLINGRNIGEFASRGEYRTVVLALKLSELAFFEKNAGERPVLLLDDVFSELDEDRRDLLSQIFKKQQTIVTTTDLDHVSENILKEAKVVEL